MSVIMEKHVSYIHENGSVKDMNDNNESFEWRLSKGELKVSPAIQSSTQSSNQSSAQSSSFAHKSVVVTSQNEVTIIKNGHVSNGVSDAHEEPVTQEVQTPEKSQKSKVVQQEVTVNGPDHIAPADKLWAVGREEAVRLRVGTSGHAALKPLSVVSAFRETVKNHPNNTALATKINGVWKTWTFKTYYEEVWETAKAFIHLGLEAFNGVGILGFNSPEWFITNFAAIFAGGLSTGIYSTNSAEACCYVAQNAKCNIIVVENDSQLQKILKVRSELPHLKAIIQYHGELKQKLPNVYTWSELKALAANVEDSVLQRRIKQQSINKCCTLIYTSGTTGNPKGVMLSQDNVIWTAWTAGQTVELVMGQESLVSYLPLSHIAGQILDMYIPLLHAASVHFAQPDALKGSLVQTLKEVRPTAFLGVPRVWEKIQEQMESLSSKAGSVKRALLGWARGVGLQGNLSRMNGGSVGFGWWLASSLVFKKVRVGLGLDRCKICMTAAAPIMRETLNFFTSLDMPIMEIYGMSETSGPHTLSTGRRWRLGSIGPAMSGASIELIGGGEEGGEICMSGRNTFMGYLDEQEKTVETIDTRGLLHSGDLGKKDNDGFYFVTGRIKELIITAGGENVAPVPIEDAIKDALPCVSNCMLVGDKKKFLSIIITLKTEVDPVTSESRDNLTKSAVDWFKERGCEVSTVSEILSNPSHPAMHHIQEGINLANKKAVSRAQIVQKFSIIPKDFTIAGGELGPTLKLKRPVVLNMYKNTIDAFYEENQ